MTNKLLFYTTREAGIYLGLTRQRVHQLVKMKRIVATYHARPCILISRQELERYQNSRRQYKKSS